MVVLNTIPLVTRSSEFKFHSLTPSQTRIWWTSKHRSNCSLKRLFSATSVMTAQASYCWHFQIQLSDIKHGLAFKTANPAEMGGGGRQKSQNRCKSCIKG